jgi:hypothetical protein
MDFIIFRLIKLMRERYGAIGPLILTRELKRLGFKDLVEMDDNQKEMLEEDLIVHVFYDMSPRKVSMMRSRLRSIMALSEEEKEEYNNIDAINFILGRPV